MKRILVPALLFAALYSNGQQPKDSNNKLKAGFGVSVAQMQPEFPGGSDSLQAFLKRTINYPPQAKKENIHGKVYVGFMVTKEGKVTDIRILSGTNELLDAEALRVAKLLPDWKPGTVDGNPVKVQFILPIDFVVPENIKE